MQPISPNYNWENRSQTDKDYWQKFVTKLYLVSIAKDKDTLASGSKCTKHFSLFLPLIALYLLSGCDLLKMSSLSWISLMASLDILCSKRLKVSDYPFKQNKNTLKA